MHLQSKNMKQTKCDTLSVVSYNIHMGLDVITIVKNIQNFAAQGVAVFCLQEFWK